MKGEEELNHMKRTLPSHHLTYETKGLQPHLEYQYWVTASTKIGEGQSSKITTQILSTTRSKLSIMNNITIIIKLFGIHERQSLDRYRRIGHSTYLEIKK